MALKIAKDAGLTDVVSEGNGANPISTQHVITGEAKETKVYLYNNDATKRYEAITIDPSDAVSTDESAWVQLAPDNAGSAGTYGAGGAALTMSDIADSNVAKPFWVKVTTPSVGDTQNKTDIKLTVQGTEFAV